MRKLTIVAALLVGLAGAALVAVATRGDDSSARRTGSIALVGDSLNVGIEPYVAEELDGWTIANDNVVGRRGEEGLAELKRMRAELAPVVVVSLGTNDPQNDVDGFRRLVDDVIRAAGPTRCVVWSTIWRDGPNEGFNAVLRDATDRHRTLEVADWASLVAARPELLAPDGVHGSPEGYAARAAQVARIAEDCYPASEPVS